MSESIELSIVFLSLNFVTVSILSALSSFLKTNFLSGSVRKLCTIGAWSTGGSIGASIGSASGSSSFTWSSFLPFSCCIMSSNVISPSFVSFAFSIISMALSTWSSPTSSFTKSAILFKTSCSELSIIIFSSVPSISYSGCMNFKLPPLPTVITSLAFGFKSFKSSSLIILWINGNASSTLLSKFFIVNLSLYEFAVSSSSTTSSAVLKSLLAFS